MISKRLVLLLWVSFLHIAGIYLFTRGFLLTRLSLEEYSDCPLAPCSLPPTHKRAVLLIIDSLRFDFVTPHPPQPPSPFHHSILTLPQRLTEKYPKKSFIFNAYADPPTATLQRIKALTTGSLPTFTDLGNNLGPSSIDEDSIIKQLKISGKKVAFMGDDTWMAVFPDSFETNMSFPYESFNVEDLHTVDNGVITHLFPLLKDDSKPFDFLIGHFMGVDHVGHRVGSDHPSMKSKLTQMNDVLTKVVDELDDDTLLVVLGDHGMDRSGDHGGDGVLETSSALWVYSKGRELTTNSGPVPSGLLQYSTFPGTTIPHRSIQQIDILPTLSLLLGLPIPYNNLGAVIPELFWRDREGMELERALELNAAQVKRYLDTCHSKPSGGELDEAWDSLQAAWASAESAASPGETKFILLSNYSRFNPILMAMGLALLGMSICASWAAYSSISRSNNKWDDWLKDQLPRIVIGLAGGAVLGLINALDCVLFAAPLVSSVVLILSSPPVSIPIILVLHGVTFFSSSFTFWEDKIVPFLAVSSIIPYVLTGFSAPTSRLRYRIVGFSLLYAIMCREEQQPYCRVTFYSSSSLSAPPMISVILAIPTAIALPEAIRCFLKTSRSDVGLAKPFLPVILTPTLLAAASYWIAEWTETFDKLGDEWSPFIRVIRTWISRSAVGWILLAGITLWYFIPLCLEIEIKQVGEKKQVTVLGFANAFGSPYLLFWSISLGLVYITSQLVGQLILAMGTVALISYLEVLDSVRDVQGMNAVFSSSTPSAILDSGYAEAQSSPFQFKDIIPVALLGLNAFYGTGHQATVSSLQWKSAFILSPNTAYPYSMITMALNTIGPLFVFTLAAPLVALWNRAPIQSKDEMAISDVQITGETTLAALGIMSYYGTLLLGTSVSAAILRRHLMVWKVFAPRFVSGFIQMIMVDIAILFGVGVGVQHITSRVAAMFKGVTTPTDTNTEPVNDSKCRLKNARHHPKHKISKKRTIDK
ncbi:hypothetical protein BDQ17DRAFT_1356258 [Cyathus striatus]|nr:hypothetical protein BDQ17DRAFT_1356258 [Cyathus striatus]